MTPLFNGWTIPLTLSYLSNVENCLRSRGLKQQQSVCGAQSQPCQSWRLAGHPTKREEAGDQEKEQEEEPEKEKKKEPAEEKKPQEEEEKEPQEEEEKEPQEKEEQEGAKRGCGGAALYLKPFVFMYSQMELCGLVPTFHIHVSVSD